MDEARVLRYIAQTYPDADIFTAGSGTFWIGPASTGSTSGSVRRFEKVVSSKPNPDYTALDQLMQHPVYAMQHWVSILNPSEATFDKLVKPLLDEAHERVARAHRKVAEKKSPT